MKKHYLQQPLLVALCLLAITDLRAGAQLGLDNREFNPYRVGFQLADWHVTISNQAKLVEIGPALNDQRNNLLLLLGGQDDKDFRRTLQITHWDGYRFVTDTSIDFIGWAVDPLMMGRFAPDPTTPPVAPPPTKNKQPKAPTQQIVVASGVYAWTGGALARLATSPPNLKLDLVMDGSPAQMVVNAGDAASVYELGQNDTHPSAFMLNPADPGYPHWGIGTQAFDGAREFLPGIRYIQTYWKDRDRWQICLQHGQPAKLSALPDATVGDTLIVYVPRAANRNKTFWQLTHAEDYEATWHSGPLPGRVLDVRVGDVTNSGKPGILVLTAENDDRERHLYYYTPVAIQPGPGQGH